MSKWVKCPDCGDEMEVPAYEGDGVYHEHICRKEEPENRDEEEKENV